MVKNIIKRYLELIKEQSPAIAVVFLASVAGVVGSYAVAGFTPGFVAAPIAGFLALTLPGIVLTLAIQILGSLGQYLNLSTAIALAVIGFTLIAAGSRWLAVGRDRPLLSAPIAFAGTSLFAFGLTGRALPSVAAGVGVGLVLAIATVSGEKPDAAVTFETGRRQALQALAGTIVVGVIGFLFQTIGQHDEAISPENSSNESDSSEGGPMGGNDARSVEDYLAEAQEKSLEIDGLEPLVSEVFYEVDISAVNPDLNASDWTLSFTGAVAEDRTMDYETLTNMAAEHRFMTLRCVGDPVNGEQMDNALWTGVPIAQFLWELEIQSGCQCVMLRAADDYFNEFPLAALNRGFLAWKMNGNDLPRKHGYPVRALIPGHWGEINVKWLTEIEFLEREVQGFWEERGWHGTGPVNMVAKIHATNHLENGRIQVGGHAYAGTQGVSGVEVSFDDGDTWEAASLSDPLPGEDVWRQWVYEYNSPGERHDVLARAIANDGTVQPSERTFPYPNGALGWVRESVDG